MEKFIVTILGVGLVAIIYWFFFGKKEEVVEATNKLTITVDGGYKPGTIRIQPDKPVTLTFIRKDANSCLEEIIFPDYKIKKYLPMNTPVAITLSPPHRESEFHCGMNMFHGKIKVIR